MSHKASVETPASDAAEKEESPILDGYGEPAGLAKTLHTRRALTVLIVASALQIVLAFILYMSESASPVVLGIEGGAGVVLVLIAALLHNRSRSLRLFTRVLSVAGTAVPAVTALVFLILAWQMSPDEQEFNVLFGWFLVAVVILPPLLVIQLVLSVAARYRRRFDLVLLRVISSAAFIGTIAVCIGALDFDASSGQILRSAYFDSFFTRTLLCAFGAVAAAMSFWIKSGESQRWIGAAESPARKPRRTKASRETTSSR